jgi:hypothetical protein
MTLKERILSYIMDPNVAFILLAIGALALYAEFNHPGAVIPGTVGVVFILLAAFALNLLPVRFAAIAMIIGAFALFAAEAKFASHGVLTTGGIVLLTLGGLFLVDAPIPEMRVHLVTALAVSIPLGLITAFLMSIAVRARRNKIVTGKQGLIGEIGVAAKPARACRKSFRPRRALGRRLRRPHSRRRTNRRAPDRWTHAKSRSRGGGENRDGVGKIFRNKDLAFSCPQLRVVKELRLVGLGQVSRDLLLTGTPRPCHRSISIVANGRVDVCDCAHSAFVMNMGGKRQIAAAAKESQGGGIPPFKKRGLGHSADELKSPGYSWFLFPLAIV